jgi:homogentisate 1,2-dioxygenase
VGKDGMAFMFETCYMVKVTDHAKNPENIDLSYAQDSWGHIEKHFDPSKK